LSDDSQGVIHGASDGGVVGEHPDAAPFQVLAGPSIGAELNTVRIAVAPTFCWKVEDIRFAFDSSFVTFEPDPSTDPTSDPLAKPSAHEDIRDELKLLASVMKDNPGCPLSVFGHADPVGPAVDPDGYNKALSGRRATAIYALLISSTQLQTAVGLWQKIASQENWGSNQKQTMQQATGLPDGTSMSSLITSYLPKLVPPELQALNIGPTNFLAQGADPQGKGDFQGCSSFNPLLIFSQQKEDSFAAGANDQDPAIFELRNLANAPNRRVMVLMFAKGTKVDPAKWPCPSASGDKSGCIKRFWSDGQTRRSTRLPDEDRKFDPTKDTFACRFYQRLLTDSPCESPLTVVQIRLFDAQARPLPFAPCLITQPGQGPTPNRATGAPPSPLGTTPGSPPGSSSSISKDDAIITLRVQKLPATVNVKWSRAKATENTSSPLPNANDPDDFEFQMDVAIDIPDADPSRAAPIRLKNLGYDVNPPIPVPGLGDPIRAFQRDYKQRFGDIVEDGTLNQPTTNAITTVHDVADPVLKAGSQIVVLR
jgi:hypothetical protein